MNSGSKTVPLDPRGKWEKLRKFNPQQKRKAIPISDDDLKLLCKQNCSVAIYHFNVCTKISVAYETDCKLLNQEPDKEQLMKIFQLRGLKIYKRFYEPRVEWFHQQREYGAYLRQDDFYYTNLIENFKSNTNEKEKSTSPPGKIFVNDSFGTSEDSDSFFKNLLLQPSPYQSTPLAGSESL